MRSTCRFAALFCLALIVLCLLFASCGGKKPMMPEPFVEKPDPIMDLVPYETFAYISISNLDDVHQLAMESPEWQELLAKEQMKKPLEKAKQAVSAVPALLGITVEDFLKSFGHRAVISVMGFNMPMPVAGLIVDTGDYKEKAESAIKQGISMTAASGNVVAEEKEYRGVPYTIVGNNDNKVKYTFLENYLIAGVGGGFEKIVDHHKDGGKSIKDRPNFQLMQQKVSMSSELSIYADLETITPMLQMFGNIGMGEEAGQLPRMIQETSMKSMKGFALSLSLTGQTHELYFHMKPEEQNPLTDLVFAPHSPMSSADVVPVPGGTALAFHIGDPVEMLDKALNLAEHLGMEKGIIEGKIQQLEGILKLNLRDELLSALTGEIAFISMLPKEPVELKVDPVHAAMQMAKVRSAVLIGVKDEKKLSATVRKLLQMVEIEPLTLEKSSYKGARINTEVLPLDIFTPGLALMPSYSLIDDLLIMSNRAESVKDTVDMIQSPKAPEVQRKLSDSRVLAYADIGNIADFAINYFMIQQRMAGNPDLPESVRERISSLGSLAVSFALGPDGFGLRLISTSDDNWLTKMFRGGLVAIDFLSIQQREVQTMEEEIGAPE